MQTNPSSTPRTDAMCREVSALPSSFGAQRRKHYLKFCRQLERELDAANNALIDAETERDMLQAEVNSPTGELAAKSAPAPEAVLIRTDDGDAIARTTYAPAPTEQQEQTTEAILKKYGVWSQDLEVSLLRYWCEKEPEERFAHLEAQHKQDQEELGRVTKDLELMTHKLVVCGIIAEGDEHRHALYQAGSKWDSQQAEKVRALRAQLSAALTLIAKKDEAFQQIADEAVQHHEHNATSGKDRLPVGYSNILNTADAALALTVDGVGEPPRDSPKG